MTQIATAACVILVLGLFWLDRDRSANTSAAIWISMAWMWISCTRSISVWLSNFGVMSSAATTDIYLDGSPVDRAVFIALLVLGLGVLASRQQQVSALVSRNGPLIAFIAYGAVSAVWSDYPDVTIKRWTKVLGNIVMVLILLTERNRSAAVRRFFRSVAFVLIPVSVLFVKYYPNLGRGYGEFDREPYYCGVATHKNELGMICMISGLACVAQLLHLFFGQKGKQRKKGPIIAYGTVLLMVGWLLHLANSMTSFTTFMMGSALLIVSYRKSIVRRPTIIHVLVAFMLCFSLFALFVDGSMLGVIGRNSTLTGRTELWAMVIKMAGNPLLGTGFESFWVGRRMTELWRIYWWHPNESHNGYLEMYLTVGWIGVAMLATVIATGYRNAIRAVRQRLELSGLLLAYLVVATIYNVTEAGFRGVNPIWISFMLAVLASSAAVAARPAIVEADPHEHDFGDDEIPQAEPAAFHSLGPA